MQIWILKLFQKLKIRDNWFLCTSLEVLKRRLYRRNLPISLETFWEIDKRFIFNYSKSIFSTLFEFLKFIDSSNKGFGIRVEVIITKLCRNKLESQQFSSYMECSSKTTRNNPISILKFSSEIKKMFLHLNS